MQVLKVVSNYGVSQREGEFTKRTRLMKVHRKKVEKMEEIES